MLNERFSFQYDILYLKYFFSLYRFSELQFLNARRAAVAASVASGLPNPSAPPNITSQASLHGAGPHPPEFHPAYRLGSYMDHLYSLQHAAAAATSPSASLHSK